jgi:hypothetical protein
MSLWALSDEWDRQGKLNEMTLVQFSELRGELKLLHRGPDGLYNENQLSNIQARSVSGVAYDDALGVSQKERDAAWAASMKRFPEPAPVPPVNVQKS